MRLNRTIDCYCLRGHACDYTTQVSTNDDSLGTCAISSIPGSIAPRSLWNFALAPLTKWDAARFLNLAVSPSLRDPQEHTSSSMSSSTSLHSWEFSEQAHAFLPMFPWMIRQLSLFFYHTLPAQILPPSYEGLVVLSGMIFNNFICLTVATLALYKLTVIVMSGDGTKLEEELKQHHHHVAIVVCLVLGVWNPALVFFATNYSESFFAASTILGHLCIQLSKKGDNIILWFLGIFTWMIGSYTRSNGILHCLWLLQDGLARLLFVLRHKNSDDENCKSNSNVRFLTNSVLGQAILILTQNTVGAILVALPCRYHDFKGWKRHCMGPGLRPSWCESSDENSSVLGSSFSLYRYVQDKHWNVGFFRYFEWKQIPNFLLAAPILMLSIAGVYRWIDWSFVTVYGKGKFPSSYKALLFGWPTQALSDSVSSGGIRDIASKTIPRSPSIQRYLLLENPRLLGHYAILAILSLLGFSLAHVQISTRMICSTSPAIIWFIAYCLLSSSSRRITGPTDTGKELKKNRYLVFVVENIQSFVWFYVGLYMFLGVILHVNFLPWT